jgi:hypothetical protein
MDSATNRQLFSVILSSNILAPYLENDPELAFLLERPNHCNIHYPSNYATADQIVPVLKGLLEYMVAERIFLNLDATKQLLHYGEKHPDVLIYDVTFNCERQSYGVCCGQIEDQIHSICVLTGNHIPDEVFREIVK